MHPAQSARFLLASRPSSLAPRRGFTLVEMLIAVAITLVMMAAVVTVFANISDSVQKRRATVEMSNSIRHVRNVLQQDLAGATCPTIPWQRPESNHGYLEIIEGPASDFSPSVLLLDGDSDSEPDGIDVQTSGLPGSNLVPSGWVTDGRALGDHDDILMLTVRNEKEPFVGRVPANAAAADGTQYTFNSNGQDGQWGDTTLRSPLAEVIWFSIENPAEELNPLNYFGEPGFRTIYRRTLLIAPSLDLGIVIRANNVDVRMGPGVMRVIPRIGRDRLDLALACLVAFQERFDLSVRLEWDPLLPGAGPNNPGQWKIVANTLADLTKRENRYEHHGFLFRSGNPSIRTYPFTVASVGSVYNNSAQLKFVVDPEIGSAATPAEGFAIANSGAIQQIAIDPNELGAGYRIRPFAFVNDSNATNPATVRALVRGSDDPAEQQVVYVTAGLVPLGGARRGEDVMLTDALAFDVRVYDPGAPLLGNTNAPDVVVEPGDAGWSEYLLPANFNSTVVFGYGAYVDLGYLGLHNAWKSPPSAVNMPALSVTPQFSIAPRTRSKLNLLGQLPPYYYEPYRVYDTWSFHYENNGINEDGDTHPVTGAPLVDEATNGFDDPGEYILDPSANPPTTVIDSRHGVDDPGERETSPPYDVPLRGMQVRLRAYERDSRQVREVGVKQHFVPE